MNRFIVLTVLLLAALTQVVPAQVRGIPPSVTSLAPGRQFIPGPSVTSLGPQGWSHSPVLLGNSRFHGTFHGDRFVGRGNSFRHSRGSAVLPVFVPMYAPYGMGVYPMIYADPSAGYDPGYATDASSMYQPDPNYAGEYGIRPPARQVTQPAVSQNTGEQQQVASVEPATVSPPAAEAKPQPKTQLIFKDGHKLDITNYVIQGQTLFNLSDDGPRKIALDELDLNKTIAENDNRGVVFQLP